MRVLPPDEFDLLLKVQELGRTRNFAETCAALGMAQGTVRYALQKHGLEAGTATEVRAVLGGRTLDELIQSGQLVRGAPAEPAGVA